MDTIENIARIKTTDVKRLEMARKKLGISGKFIGNCLGLSGTVWSNWITQSGEIPEKHLCRVINIFETIENLLNGKKCAPIDTDSSNGKKKDVSLIIDFLQEVQDPKISVFADRNEEIVAILEEHSRDASILLELINN